MKTLNAAALVISATLLGASAYAAGNAEPDNTPLQGAYGQQSADATSRAAVQADLALWQRAGMDRFYRGQNTPDIYSSRYREAQANYLRMRNGPEFQQELQRQQQ
ncbi:DUF4148 domain-containing protein [Bordetella genomosp. 13]|uniref:DUF4148 domain-containing protein n=1 Tax=Bordetella genomosp. 13 TaxID=463040 RepID=UPI0011A95A0A|nr:DUF4148 domain-containing protein [Bordetella genomosp. 13]